MTEENTGTLSADEAAYFESGGEKPLAQPEKQEPSDGEGKEGLQAEAEGQVEQHNRDEKGRFVPHQALHAEREEHKKTKAQVEELRQFKAVMEDRWNTMLKAAEKPEQKRDEDAAPDPNVDIFAFSQWQQRQVDKLNAKLAERDQREASAAQAQQQDTEIWNHWRGSVVSYSQQQADFGDAAQFLSDMREKQLSAYGIIDDQFATPAARTAQINRELKQIVLAAGQRGLNPAEVIYQMAQKYGYAPKAADPGALKLSDGLERVQKAQEASKTVGAVPSRQGGGEMTLQTLMAMPRGEFETWLSDPKNERLYTKLMGG